MLAPCSARINVNPQILAMYLEHLMLEIAQPGDDGNYGSAAMYDVMILQALSKRIHYGKFVAEAKFQGQREQYTALIRSNDAAGIMDLLTDRAVELKVRGRERGARPAHLLARGGRGQLSRERAVSATAPCAGAGARAAQGGDVWAGPQRDWRQRRQQWHLQDQARGGRAPV